MTAYKSILAYVAQLLAAVPDATVFRSRAAALDKTEGTGIVVMPKESESENRAGGGPMGLVVRNFTFKVVVITRAQPPEGLTADDIADPVMEAIHAALFLDTTLGNRIATLIGGITEWDFEVADGTAMAAEMHFMARYQTKASTLCLG